MYCFYAYGNLQFLRYWKKTYCYAPPFIKGSYLVYVIWIIFLIVRKEDIELSKIEYWIIQLILKRANIAFMVRILWRLRKILYFADYFESDENVPENILVAQSVKTILFWLILG